MRTLYVLDKVNLDLRNIGFCLSGNTTQKGKQQNIMTLEDSQEPSFPFRIWIKDQTTFTTVVLCFEAANLNI